MMFENSDQRLYQHFRLIVEMMNVEQMRKLAVHNENHVMHKDRIEHFAFQIKKQNLNATDVMDYVNAYRLKDQKMSFGPRALAKQCAGLFLYHLIEIVLPNPEMEIQIGRMNIFITNYSIALKHQD